MTSKNDVILKIQEQYENLSNSEKKVADYILVNPYEVVQETIANIAKVVNVSEPTVVRFCRKLDFSGYQDFKIALARGSARSEESLKVIHDEAKETDTLKEVALKVMNSHILAMQQTFHALDYEKLQEFVDILLGAKKVEVFGLGGSGTVAIDVENKFLRTGIATNACIDAHIQLMRTALLDENDAIIIFSNSGTTKHFQQVLKIAKQKGVRVILITSAKNTSLTKGATLVFQIYAKETSHKKEPSSARIAMIAIMDVVVTKIALKMQDVFIENVYKTRQALEKEK